MTDISITESLSTAWWREMLYPDLVATWDEIAPLTIRTDLKGLYRTLVEQEALGPEPWLVSPNLHDDGIIHLDLISPYPPELIELLKKQVEDNIVPMELRFHTTPLCNEKMMIDAENFALIFDFDERYTLLSCCLDTGHEGSKHEDAESGIEWQHFDSPFSSYTKFTEPLPKLEPHMYWPDFQAMGDCATCGNVKEAKIHDWKP